MLQIQPLPFSDEGNMRYPFHALWIGAPNGKLGGKQLREDRLMVLKEFRRDSIKFPWLGDRVDLQCKDAYELQV